MRKRLEAQLAAAREHVHRSTGQRVRWAKAHIAAMAEKAQRGIRLKCGYWQSLHSDYAALQPTGKVSKNAGKIP